MFDSKPHCEALVRHLAETGAETFEKNRFNESGDLIASVFVFYGPNAAAMTGLVRQMLHEQGFTDRGRIE